MNIPPNNENRYSKSTSTHMFEEALFTIAKRQTHSKHPSPDEWTNVGGISSQWNISQPGKRKEVLIHGTM